MSCIENREETELKQIALDMFKEKIFTDRHILESEREGFLTLVFPLIMFGCFKDYSQDDMKDIGLLFEYLSKAGPTAVNGYPVFFSIQILNKHDTDIVFKYYNEFKKILN